MREDEVGSVLCPSNRAASSSLNESDPFVAFELEATCTIINWVGRFSSNQFTLTSFDFGQVHIDLFSLRTYFFHLGDLV